MRLIDADALQALMYHDAFETDSEMQRWDSGCWIRYKMFENAIADAPTIEAEPRKHGRWILNRQGNWACSLCGNDPYHDNMKNMNYCPNCGAKMDEVTE